MLDGRSTNAAMLADLPASLRAVALNHGTTFRVPPGRAIVSFSGETRDVFILLDGAARVSLYSLRGRLVAVHMLAPGDLFGELSALDDLPRSADIVAVEPCGVLRLEQRVFLACAESSPEVGLWLARRLAAGMRRLTQQVFELSALNVQARVQSELCRLAQRAGSEAVTIQLRPAPSHAELADRIGTHREAVTRELNALAALSIIRHGRRQLEIIDLPRLKAMVGAAL